MRYETQINTLHALDVGENTSVVSTVPLDKATKEHLDRTDRLLRSRVTSWLKGASSQSGDTFSSTIFRTFNADNTAVISGIVIVKLSIGDTNPIVKSPSSAPTPTVEAYGNPPRWRTRETASPTTSTADTEPVEDTADDL